MTNASRYSLGLIDLIAHKDAAHQPIGGLRKPDPALYNIAHNITRYINNDTLPLLRTGAPMYPIAYVSLLTQ